jgi:SAM-dependent methyltransferase
VPEEREPRSAPALSEAYAQERAAAHESASQYDAAYETPFWAGERRAFVEGFESHARRRGIDLMTARILDVGTGTGSVLAELRRLGARNLAAIDISDDMLEIARRKFPDIEFAVGPAEETAYPPDSFDAVLGFSFLHHLPDLRLFFSWLASVLRPGGVFAFSDPNARSIMERERLRWVVWGLVYPVQKPLRLLNRRRLALRPQMVDPKLYSDVHGPLTKEGLLSSLSPELEADVSSHGVIAPSFNNALVDRPLDRFVLRAARALDSVLPLEGDVLVINGSMHS